MGRLAIAVSLVVALVLPCACDEQQPANSPLHEAIILGQTQHVEQMLDEGADPNAVDHLGSPAIVTAASGGRRPAIRLLLNHGADINAPDDNGRTALIAAIQSDQPTTALLLLQQPDVDVQKRESHGSTPLVEALAMGQSQVARALVERGADVNRPGPLGRTPLWLAATHGDADTIAWLLQQGADANAAADSGRTALHAIMIGMIQRQPDDDDARKALDLLIDHSSNINVADANGATPLHLAVMMAPAWVSDVLLRRGAEKKALDNQGATPIAYLLAAQQQQMQTSEAVARIINVFRAHGLTDDAVVMAGGMTLDQLEARLGRQ